MLNSNHGLFFSGRVYKEVQFHMDQGSLRKSRLGLRANTADTVCSIVGCHLMDIGGHSYDESNNCVNLNINELFLKKLLSLTHEEKNKLRKLGINYFIVDFITIYLEHTKGKFRCLIEKVVSAWIYFIFIFCVSSQH